MTTYGLRTRDASGNILFDSGNPSGRLLGTRKLLANDGASITITDSRISAADRNFGIILPCAAYADLDFQLSGLSGQTYTITHATTSPIYTGSMVVGVFIYGTY